MLMLTLVETAPELVAMGMFMNPDTTRIIVKRLIITGHPFKVHKKTATVRYMFFNPGECSIPSYPLSRSLNDVGTRRHTVLQAYPVAHETRAVGTYQGVAWYAWILQGALRWADQPDGHGVHVFV